MRLDQISIALRPRTPWEAMDLGQALVRQHAATIWRVWFALTLPLLLVFNALGWWLDLLWLASLVMWWLKPLFDRAVLYVLSRAVFGQAPSVRQTLRAPELWSPRQLLPWLTWRRLHPSRSLLLPVDMLEGLPGARRRARIAVLQRAISSQALGLTLVCLNFEIALFVSVWVLGLMFVPVEFLSESARVVWQTFFETPPAWAQIVANVVAWLAMSLVEPFYVGAGFGLYLNRRTQLEAWDVELVFRRLALRASQATGLALLLSAMLFGTGLLADSAQAAELKTQAKSAHDARQFLGPEWRQPEPGFDRAVTKAFQDPLLSPRQTVTRWVANTPPKPNQPKPSASLEWLAMIVGLLSQYGLWLLAGLLLVLLLSRLPQWLPWVRDRLQTEPVASEIVERVPDPAETLPDDVAQVAAQLWHEGRRREALALLYRASVERIAQRLGHPFPPGATEAECLRRARRLQNPEVESLVGIVVRTWQGAAYARRYPQGPEFDALLLRWSQTFGARP